MEATSLRSPQPAAEEALAIYDTLALLTEALAARGIPFAADAGRGAVAVGDHTISVWATCCPYAVYASDDWLPRCQFGNLAALLQFLQDGRCRAA
jgi:hypothetical protein